MFRATHGIAVCVVALLVGVTLGTASDAQPAFASESVSYDFNTAGDLDSSFNSYTAAGTVSQSSAGGIGDSGAIEVGNAVSQDTNAVFTSQDGYSLGPSGSTYTFSAQMRSLGTNGYSGMGFTAESDPASDNASALNGNPFRPNDSLGISVHGSGFIFTNGGSRISG